MLQVSSISYKQQSIYTTVYPTAGEIEQDTQTDAVDEPTTSVNQNNVIEKKEHSEHKEEDTEVSNHNIQKDVNSVTDKMVEAVKKSHERPDKLARSINKLFSKFMKSFSGENFHHSPVMNISKMIENDFYKKISEKKEKEAAHNKYSENNIENEETPILSNTV